MKNVYRIFLTLTLSLMLCETSNLAADSHKEPLKVHSDKKDTQEKHGNAESETNEKSEHKEEGHAHNSEEKEEGSARIGPGMAILDASKESGIRLSDKAIKTIGVRTVPVTMEDLHRISPQSLVHFQDEVGVYRLRAGFFKLIEVEVVKTSTNDITIKTTEIKPNDQIVTQGTGLLRAAELEAWGGSGEGHGH